MTKAATPLPDSPGHQNLAGNPAEAMVAALESGDGRINLDIIVPWIDQSARLGVPPDLRSALHRRVREARLLAIRKLKNEGTERSPLLAVEAMKAMRKKNPQDSDSVAAEANLIRALLNDAEKPLEIGDLKSASLNLKAAVSLGNPHSDDRAAAGRMARRAEDAFSKALNEKQFTAVAALYRDAQPAGARPTLRR